LLYIAPKYTFLNKSNMDLSAGVLYMRIPSFSKGAGIAYGVGTFGSNDNALSVGIGYGFVDGDFADKPMLTLGGELRVSRYVKLISENWLFPAGDVGLLSAGLRFFGERMAGDFGFFVPTEESDFIPWLGFAYNF